MVRCRLGQRNSWDEDPKSTSSLCRRVSCVCTVVDPEHAVGGSAGSSGERRDADLFALHHHAVDCGRPVDTVSFSNATPRFYTVTGETANAIRNSLDQNRPGSYDAHTAWQFQWNGCGQDFQVNYTISIDFPEWAPPIHPNGDLIGNWNRYIHALALHEQGHVDRVVDSIPYFIETMQNVACDQVNPTGQQLLDEINQINADYDDETNHGETQGAVFP